LFVIKTKLKEVASKDLFGLSSLQHLEMTNNDLKSLPDDLFTHTKKLKMICFDHNKLEFMSSRLLDLIPDAQWEGVSFEKNTKINAFYLPIEEKGLKSVKELKDLIDLSCSPHRNNPQGTTTNEFKKLWELRQFSDFKIVVGTKEVSVHKCVLAAQSPVFASMLENDEQVKATNKLEIKDCNEEAVEEFLRGLYTGEIENEENNLDLFSLACTFDVEVLKTAYEGIVIKTLNEDTALKALKLGTLYKSDKIIEVAASEVKKMLPGEIKLEALKRKPERIEEIVEVMDANKRLKKLIEDFNNA
jgi:hypothetical protein